MSKLENILVNFSFFLIEKFAPVMAGISIILMLLAIPGVLPVYIGIAVLMNVLLCVTVSFVLLLSIMLNH